MIQDLNQMIIINEMVKYDYHCKLAYLSLDLFLLNSDRTHNKIQEMYNLRATEKVVF